MPHKYLIPLTLLLCGLSFAKDKSLDKLLAQGREAESRRQYDQALDAYESALSREPSNPECLLATRRVRFQAAQSHVETGRKLRENGDLAGSFAEFQKAYAIDPSSSVAQQEMKRTYQMIERQKNQTSASPAANVSDRILTPTETARKDLQERLSHLEGTPQLKPVTSVFSTLRINNQPATVLYETVGKLAGINVVFDPDVKAQVQSRLTVDLSNNSLEQALDYLAVLTHTFWKPLSSNTIFVTIENANKRRDYEEQAVKVFYLQNTTSAQEVTDLSTTLRTIVDLRRVVVYPSQSAIVIRGSADQVALAEKLVYDMDKPKAEVIIDVVVMETSKNRSHDIAAGLTYGSGSVGLSVPIGINSTSTTTSTTDSTTSTTTTSTAATTIKQLAHLSGSDFSLTLPGAQFTLLAGDSKTKILQSPQVRAADNQKAVLKVGERIPIATGSYQSSTAVASSTVSPLVSTQYNYQDVGVNVDITPHVHGNSEVSMHVEIEISNVDGYSSLGGLEQPIIGQRKIVHDVRMHEGEVNLLGGLSQKQNSRTNTGLPGLVKIPLLRALFGEDKNTDSGSEILIALIPHIIRTSDLDELDMRSIAVGNETTIQLRSERGVKPVAPPLVPPVAAPPSATTPTLLLSAPVSTVHPGSPVTVILQGQNLPDLSSLPLRFRYDPKILSLEDVRLAGALEGSEHPAALSKNILNDRGEAAVSLSSPDGSTGISANGALLVLTFTGKASGATTVTMPDADALDARHQPVRLGASGATIRVE